MTDVWNEIETAAEKADGGLFIKLKDGESINLVFLGAPHPIETAFVDGKTVPFTEELARRGVKSQTRVRMNVWRIDDGGGVGILELAVGFFKKVILCRKKYGDERFANSVFTLTRTGEKMNTKYDVLYDRDLNAEQKAVRDSLKLLPLERPDDDDEKHLAAVAEVFAAVSAVKNAASAPVAAPVQSFAPPAAADPFEQRGGVTRDQLIVLARTLPREAVLDALNRGGWKKFSDIPDNQLQAVYDSLTGDSLFA